MTRWSPRQTWGVQSFRFFLAAIAADGAAEAAWLVTFGWLAAQAASPLMTGVILSSGALPGLLLTLTGGHLGGRFGPGRVALFTLLTRSFLLGGWAIALGASTSVLVVVAAAISLGVVNAIHDPAMGSSTVELLPREAQEAATLLERVVGRGSQAAGAALGGLLLGNAGAHWAVAAACGLTLTASFSLFLARRGKPRLTVDEGPRLSLSGLRLVAAHPVLSSTIPVQGVTTLVTSSMLTALLPLIARAEGWSPQVYGAAAGTFAVGLLLGLIALVALGWLSDARLAARRRLTFTGLAAAGSCLAVAAATSALDPGITIAASGLAGVLIAPVGPTFTGFARAAVTAKQAPTVVAVIVLATTVIEPIGWLVTAAASSISGPRIIGISVGGVGAAVCLVLTSAIAQSVPHAATHSPR